MIFFVTLAIGWFFLYWVIGGVFFACVALLRLRRLRKARFSCLFSLSAALCAAAAAWGGAVWLEKTSSRCLSAPLEQISFPLLASCAWFQLLISAAVGLVVLLLLGFILLKFSSWKDRSWLTSFAERLELGGSENEEN